PFLGESTPARGLGADRRCRAYSPSLDSCRVGETHRFKTAYRWVSPTLHQAACVEAFSGTASRTLSRTSSGSIPSAWASKLSRMRWRREGRYTRRRSSKLTLYRPSSRARTLAASTRVGTPRGLLPHRTYWLVASGAKGPFGWVATPMRMA